MSDMISRQTAISAICNACGKIDCDKMDKCEKLQLPPANSSEIPNNSDTISRQAAIDAFDKQNWSLLNIPICKEIRNAAKDTIRALPGAQPERKKGKWNFIGDQMFECTECGTCYTQGQFHQMRVRITDSEFPKFCPNCGADMRGGEAT